MSKIKYQAYVIKKINAGIKNIKNSKTVSHEKAKNKMRKWLS